MTETEEEKKKREKENLEIVIGKKVSPMVSSAMQRFLGVTIGEINEDISDKLKKNPFMDFEVDASMPYKKAKNLFRRYYLVRLIQLHLGNVSKVADVAGVDRRTIHRMLKKLRIEVKKHRDLLVKKDYVKQGAIQSLIETTLEQYKASINPAKLADMYKNVPNLSSNIIKELPEIPVSLKEAEREFEKKYFKEVLRMNKCNVTLTAKKIGLRYETLHRKIKSLGIKL